ncbi:TrmB family transcriptional regulator [Candidatus Bathyarchaeota archaeon]|nr:TrmB family transcriptional regulator [Candidatus Bathyarchaeota archaeon]
MSISERTKKSLRDIGLTGYESMAYLHLVISGPSPANQISNSTGLPYSKIYDVLANLEKKGWVEVESGRPKKYYPKPPSDALEARKLQIESSLKKNINRIMGELQPLYSKKGIEERPDISIVRGEFNIVIRLREILNKSEEELMIATVSLPPTLLEMLRPILKHLKSMNVQIQMIVKDDVDIHVLNELSLFGELKVKERMFGGGIISDRKRALLLLGGEEDSEYLAICSDHIGLADLSREYFEYLWKETKTWKKSRNFSK